ncbi:MAG: hypothetical protein A3A43_03395 [Candidatus Liptonbacteria bacterium RIFCSPLOWO2_01_FULL_56_20]|uniref:Uncharacterized protein n=1 Tax=Candidatus Liptonbacteria bacterium RIFCSPLOWO2_01_FULL_56_20 TaxID=1798652 RepID=A0A1G2CLY8_9BACT|nr:MAG: hypothetical protein UY96_C0001G0009 [Parcubacteria group bacterium GW2011_GWB1_56_8]OGY97646.1 MAG: hypothetical protein A2681_02955 [Candidatus Liptonbacteria bacterium RIFCSPHIGHO2_01_FULL_56_18b]OGZ01458.1 MAG: hypothetical protein A3A43_03395 [Candidatus Liptonbacteria bacterium RIFCSPLOWO2_01_FULL_56_20]
MRKFFRVHQEIILTAIGTLFALAVAAAFIWGLGAIITNFNLAINRPTIPSVPPDFNIRGAQEVLGARGISE